ncbi:hypothetical protein BHE74_00013941 [Ensete ventricosum]|nr:hypothetical protein BHE74_00013941 [Ensete ventricosum]
MEIRPSWEEALAFPTGKRARELEVDEEDIEEIDMLPTKAGQQRQGDNSHRSRVASHRFGGCGQSWQRRSDFLQVWGLRSIAVEYDSTGAKFKNSIRSNYHRTIMPPQDQAHVKDADLEQIPMNMKERDRYVVNHGEGLTVVDFDSHVRPG